MQTARYDAFMQLEQLAEDMKNPIEPPISEIEKVLQQYLSARALPAKKASPSDEDKFAVDFAIHALSVITVFGQDHFFQNDKLVPCVLHAWPEIWKWLQFLDEQCCQRARYGDKTKLQALIMIASALANMSLSKCLQRELQSTPGVVIMLTRLWKDEWRYPGVVQRSKFIAADPRERPFTGALEAVLLSDNLTPNCIPDVIAASGGAKTAATNAIQHLQAVLAERPTQFKTIYNHISLISHLFCRATPEILYAMLHQDMIMSLVKMFLWFEKQSSSDPADEDVACQCMGACVYLLIKTMGVVSSPSPIVRVLDAGLLPVVLKLLSRVDKSPTKSLGHFKLLFDTLYQYLVYREVIRSVARMLSRGEHLYFEDMLGETLGAAWTGFKTLAQKRIVMKEKFDKKDDEPRSRCDLGNCHALIDHDDLLRCSGCSTTSYCGKQCQRMDWPAHKPTCQATQRILRDSSGTDTRPRVDSKGTRFIGFMVISDIREQLSLSDDTLAAVRRSPSEFAINADYTRVPYEISIGPIDESLSLDAYMEAVIKQASQSEGKLMVAIVKVQRGWRAIFSAFLIDMVDVR